VERDVDVPTAEAVAVRFELAGLGSRFLALAVDLAIQILVVIGVVIGLLLIGLLTRAGGSIHAAPETLKLGYAFLIAIAALASFVLFFGYFIAFELLWNGQSPGKKLLGLRVIRDGGFPVDAGASVIRNLVRVVEAGIVFYVVSAFVMLLSPENKRLGDMAAGTIVVRDDAAAIPVLATLSEEDGTNDGLDREDRALIVRYLARRPSLDAAASHEIAAAIAARIRPKLRASFHYLDDLSLIEHVARSRG
jgi:uncharacterized RDD family membrane protein YckC